MDIIEEAKQLLRSERAAAAATPQRQGKVTVVMRDQILDAAPDTLPNRATLSVGPGTVAGRERNAAFTTEFMAEVRRLGELAQQEYDKQSAAAATGAGTGTGTGPGLGPRLGPGLGPRLRKVLAMRRLPKCEAVRRLLHSNCTHTRANHVYALLGHVHACVVGRADHITCEMWVQCLC
jgi:hypothetical protein